MLPQPALTQTLLVVLWNQSSGCEGNIRSPVMAYHKGHVQPAGWAPVLGFQSLPSDSCLLMRGSLTDPVPLYYHSHLYQQSNKRVKILRSHIFPDLHFYVSGFNNILEIWVQNIYHLYVPNSKWV